MTTVGDIPISNVTGKGGLSHISMSDVTSEDELMHYGVKGMHWGIRKDRGSGNSGPTRNNLSNISDSDLQKVVSRMRLEQQYRDITTAKAVKSGRKQVAKYANQAVNAVMTTVISATIGAAVKSHFDNGGGLPKFSRNVPEPPAPQPAYNYPMLPRGGS